MLLDELYETTIDYSIEVGKSSRKKIGQFFTPPPVAEYMASLMDYKKSSIRILEPGAGTLMLTGAICEEISKNEYIQSVHIDLFESDEKIIPTLKRNIELIKEELEKHSKQLTYTIIQDNFILHYEYFWKDINNENIDLYDLIICNPPYKKISKSAEESVVMDSVVFGQPNIYFLFMALSAKLLKEEGQLIFITPRSFTSGAYFRKFREYFLNTVHLTHLHLFHSREDVFDSDKVLQESVILRAVKSTQETNTISISSSDNMYMEESVVHEVPYETVVNLQSENLFIMIPTNQEEIFLLNSMRNWQFNLISLGFKLKTGPVVDFRVTELLREDLEKDTVPLIWSIHFSEHKIKFPIPNSKNPQHILNLKGNKKLLLESKDYILVKRFTSKEEKRRVQCALYLSQDFNCDVVGVENHLNYITKLKGTISKEELYGIFALLNSSFIDIYYRILNGSTQVNATETNSIPLPSIKDVERIGKKLLELDNITTEACDNIIKEVVNEQENLMTLI